MIQFEWFQLIPKILYKIQRFSKKLQIILQDKYILQNMPRHFHIQVVKKT